MNRYPKLMMVKYSKSMQEEIQLLVISEDNGGYVCRVECGNTNIYEWYGCARELTTVERSKLLDKEANTLIKL